MTKVAAGPARMVTPLPESEAEKRAAAKLRELKAAKPAPKANDDDDEDETPAAPKKKAEDVKRLDKEKAEREKAAREKAEAAKEKAEAAKKAADAKAKIEAEKLKAAKIAAAKKAKEEHAEKLAVIAENQAKQRSGTFNGGARGVNEASANPTQDAKAEKAASREKAAQSGKGKGVRGDGK